MHSGIDLQHTDPAVRVQDDLYGYLNGTWLAEAEIPADRSSHGVFHALRDTAEAEVREIIEKAAANSEPGTVGEKVGVIYASFMDADGVEAKGRTPIAADLAEIRAVADLDQFLELDSRMQRDGVAGGLLGAFVNTDDRDSTRYVIYLEQGGIGLPDEAYYREEQFAEIRSAYEAHIARMLLLGGWVQEPNDAAAAAERILALETDIAAQHWDKVECRDAVKTYNKEAVGDVPGFSEAYSLATWLGAVGAPMQHVDEVIVRQPSFVASLAGLLAEHPVDTWKDWLAWSLIRRNASLLDSEIVQANFDFYGTTLTGAPQLRERWKRGVSLVEGSLGEAVGELYVAEHFPPEAKARMSELVDNLVAAYRERLEVLPWMSPETRQRALDKLGAFTPKIGYPDKWKDYTALEVSPDDLVGNVRRVTAVESDREWRKLGGPVDRLEWFMTPQTVNAYYNPGMNEIVFPAAILQPPFFDLEADDAVNYGAIGAVIGHEIGHGFDDQGSKFDGEGNLSDWWTPEDRERFDDLAKRLIDQFDGLRPRALPEGEDHGVNGALTVGENIGDLGGAAVAMHAYRLSLGGQPSPVIDGLTGEQRFFLGWAQVWRSKAREAEAIRLLTIDPHSPAEFRCNIVANLAEFHEAFDVQPGDGMWREEPDRVVIW